MLVGTSRWVVDKPSYLTCLTIEESTVIATPQGHRVTIAVDGVETPVKTGKYEGNIV